MKRIMRIRRTVIVIAVLCCIMLSSSVGLSAEKITMVDFSWDSVQIHNRIAAFIFKHGFGYDTDFIFAQSAPGTLGLERGDIDVAMELWIMSYKEWWEKAISEGKVLDLGDNFPKAFGGWYVPAYVIQGDEERGIEPLAPDLRSVLDLPRYWEIFIDRENPKKGRLYNGPTGWSSSSINITKLKTYGLDDTYEIFSPGSDTALSTAILSAYKKGKPILAYYWEPTWLMGSLNMVLLEEPEHDPSRWGEGKDYGCGWPPRKIRIGVNAEWAEDHPELVEVLQRYETTMEQNNEFLAYMKKNDAGVEETAMWFMKNNVEQWRSWMDPDIADKIESALNNVK